jgi:hypothetical protein
MRTEVLLFALMTLATACGLAASPGDYGSEWTEGAPDASSEDGG